MNRTVTDHMMEATNRDCWILCHLSEPAVAFTSVSNVVPETWVCWREGHEAHLLSTDAVAEEIREYSAVYLVEEPPFTPEEPDTEVTA